MPYDDSATSGFANNANMGDFLANAIDTFLTTATISGGLGWAGQDPADGPGTGATRAKLYSRGGVGTEAAPFWFPKTNTKTLWSFTGNDVNTVQESYDQPANPMNHPSAASPADITSGSIAQMTSMGMTTLPGPYSDYWLFGGANAEYFHMVLKVADRQYRHFHVGMLDPLNSGLDADTFYITSHRWAGLSPDNLSDRNLSADAEHRPYLRHILPFSNQPSNNLSGGRNIRSQGLMLYSPNYGTDGYDWWMMSGVENSGPSMGGGGVAVAGRYQQINQPGNARSVVATTKTVGDVNATSDDVLFGWGFVSGYEDALGSILFSCEPTFTSDGIPLVPIHVALPSDFESARRYAPVGVIPDVFRVNMKTLDAEQEISIGADTFTVFPLINKDANATTDGEGYSGYEGLAYKKITANAV